MTLTDLERYQPFWRLFTRLHAAGDTVLVGVPKAENVLTNGIINVAPYNRIRFRILGTNAANETGSFTLYGWHSDGVKQVVAIYDIILGTEVAHDFTNAAYWRDELINKQLTGTVLEADTYTTPETFDEFGVVTPSTQLANSENFVDVDLTASQYQWLQLVTAIGTAATLGAIWVPTQLKQGFGPLNIA